MSDERLRELEKAAAEGDPAAVERWRRERCRSGLHAPPIDRLRVARVGGRSVPGVLLCRWCQADVPVELPTFPSTPPSVQNPFHRLFKDLA